jgi:glycosyltransferase involved in cell wall biosynthesis
VAPYDYVFIHREASPIGPPVFEWVISKLWKKRIIYDFDDAVWIPNTTTENKIVSWIKAFWKIKYICKWAYKVVGGNEYLCNYAKNYNSNVILIPTCVDVVNQHAGIKNQNTDKIVIGWTGSHSTMLFLNNVIDVLQQIAKEFDTEIIIISNRAPQFHFHKMRFIPWNESSEIYNLMEMNIGIMPLEDDPWCEGKCGFKLIQYMSLGIPAIASPVGVNKKIIEEGVNGLLCTTKEEWYNALAILIKSKNLRIQMGLAGRKKVETNFSLQANAGSFLALFN